MRKGWHILYEDGAVTVARRLPVRFDVRAETVLPMARKTRLAQQIRQDVWRALQRVRGFAPIVRVTEMKPDLHVIAGGQMQGPVSKDHIEAKIQGVLDDVRKRERWVRWAQ
ncbi:MAG: hypothetical protein AAFW87_06500 [Pseudomonadota bacterium]